MLISSDISQAPTVQKLVQIWGERYKPQVSFSTQHFFASGSLARVTSPEGRHETAEKLHRSLIKLNCEFAVTQTWALHKYVSSTINSSETEGIVQCTCEIYLTLLDFYQQIASVSSKPIQDSNPDLDFPLFGLNVSTIVELANLLEPLLLEYQNRHQISDDWGKVGFLTTHLNFSNVALLNNLPIVEQIFVKPYFKFLEEQVALPWQRMCAAASTHSISSPAYQLVHSMLPLAEEISQRIYLRLLRKFPKMTMRRGRLDHPAVRHSCIRDLNMFQAYLWLSVLQGNLEPVEDELVYLCTMVMPRVAVPWEMIVEWHKLLMSEIMGRTALRYQALLTPYIGGFIQAFERSQSELVESF